MALGDIEALQSELQSILTSSSSTGENETPAEAMARIADEKASAMAQAISDYVDSITLTVPSGSFIAQVTGQAVGTPNPNPVEVKKT